MQIELKNIKEYPQLSEETTAYSADLYVDGKKVGQCSNEGRGGNDRIQAIGKNEKDYLANSKIITAAESFCKTLPDDEWIGFEGQKSTQPMTLDIFTSNIVTAFLEQKDIAKFKKKMEKDMDKGILVGKDGEYGLYKTTRPISEIITSGKGILFLNDQLRKISTKLKDGERILNTNFPAGVVIPEPVKA